MLKVYLCGPINACTDSEAKDWRAIASDLLLKLGLRVLDPMDRDYRGRELEPGIAKEIVENDKLDLDACSALIVYYHKPSVGTSMEILYAKERGRIVALIDTSTAPLSPWLVYHSTKIFKSIQEACEWLAPELL